MINRFPTSRIRCLGIACAAVLALLAGGCQMETDVTTVVRPDGSAERRLRQVCAMRDSTFQDPAPLGDLMDEGGIANYRFERKRDWVHYSETFDGYIYRFRASYNVAPGNEAPDLLYRPTTKSPYGIDLEFENSGPRISRETRDGKPTFVYHERITVRQAIAVAARQLANHVRQRARVVGIEMKDADEQAVAKALEGVRDSSEFMEYMQAAGRNIQNDYAYSVLHERRPEVPLERLLRKLEHKAKALAEAALITRGLPAADAHRLMSKVSLIAGSSWQEVPYLDDLYVSSFIFRVRMPGKVIETNGIRTKPDTIAWPIDGQMLFAEQIDFFAVSETR